MFYFLIKIQKICLHLKCIITLGMIQRRDFFAFNNTICKKIICKKKVLKKSIGIFEVQEKES